MDRPELLCGSDEPWAWKRLQFPPDWWLLPLLVVAFGWIAHVGGLRGTERDLAGVGIGIILFLLFSMAAARAFVYRLENRLAEMQSKVDELSAALQEATRERRP